MSVLAVHHLTKRFGDVVAVDDLSFEVDEGTVTGFLGPNGAGKTTTLRMLLGLVGATSGSATVAGRPYRSLDEPIRRVGAVLEGSSFHPGRRAADHLRVLAAAAALPRQRIDEVLVQVGLTGVADRRVKGFSLGMLQRLSLAAALLGDPRILILDEPANGLDPEGIHWLRRFLRAFADEGGTVLVSSHVLAEVAQTVDQVVIIARGRLVSHSRLDALTDRATREVRVRSPQAAALHHLLAGAGIVSELAAPDLVVAQGATPDAVGRVAAEGRIVIHEMGSAGHDLEGIFLELTGTHEGGIP